MSSQTQGKVAGQPVMMQASIQKYDSTNGIILSQIILLVAHTNVQEGGVKSRILLMEQQKLNKQVQQNQVYKPFPVKTKPIEIPVQQPKSLDQKQVQTLDNQFQKPVEQANQNASLVQQPMTVKERIAFMQQQKTQNDNNNSYKPNLVKVNTGSNQVKNSIMEMENKAQEQKTNSFIRASQPTESIQQKKQVVIEKEIIIAQDNILDPMQESVQLVVQTVQHDVVHTAQTVQVQPEKSVESHRVIKAEAQIVEQIETQAEKIQSDKQQEALPNQIQEVIEIEQQFKVENNSHQEEVQIKKQIIVIVEDATIQHIESQNQVDQKAELLVQPLIQKTYSITEDSPIIDESTQILAQQEVKPIDQETSELTIKQTKIEDNQDSLQSQPRKQTIKERAMYLLSQGLKVSNTFQAALETIKNTDGLVEKVTIESTEQEYILVNRPSINRKQSRATKNVELDLE